MNIKDGTYVYSHDGQRDRLTIKNGSISFPSSDDSHNLDMFPAGKISEYTQKKLQHYISTGLLQLVK